MDRRRASNDWPDVGQGSWWRSPLRIAMVCPYSFSRPGGVQGQVIGLARALLAMGHDVAVVAPDDERPLGWIQWWPPVDEVPAPGSGGRGVAGAAGGDRGAGEAAEPTVAAEPAATIEPAAAVARDRRVARGRLTRISLPLRWQGWWARRAWLAKREIEQRDARAGGAFVAGRSTAVRANGSIAPVALSPAAALRARDAVRRFAPNVLHLHEPLAPALGYWFLAQRQVAMVGTFHRAGTGRSYRYLRPVGRWAASRLDARCAVSEAARDTAVALAGGSYEVLFNGVELERFSQARPWPSAGPAVLFLGRHEPRKGLEILLAAFAHLAEANGDVTLWIAGDGPETPGLRRRYPDSDRVQWLGVLGDDEVAARMAAATVLCAPSLGGESFGMVLLEAMAAGCAVVASDIPGYRSAAGGHAVLVPPADPAALSEALSQVLADAATGTGRSSPTARREAADHAAGWSMDRLAARYVELYRRTMTSRAATVQAARARRLVS